ncbi:MAG: DeoR/GlpR family DNA-binding transcription regulator [Pseudomonadota bacterium]
MALSTRQEQIYAALQRDGRVDVDALAEEMAVATQTIRRDLNELSARGLAQRVHGGARRANSISNIGYEARRALAQPEKAAIARAAADLIPDECSVMLNIGTTTEEVARALFRHKGLVVISNNVNVITTLMASDASELILAGGAVRPTDGAIIGEAAVEFIGRYKADFAIIGASALDEDGAILDFDAREVSVARAILANARTRILVADATKFSVSAPVRIAGIGEIDFFVTNAPPPRAFFDAATAAETKIIVTDPEHGS